MLDVVSCWGQNTQSHSVMLMVWEDSHSIFAILLPEGLWSSHFISLSFRFIFCKMGVIVTPLSSNNEKIIK